MARLAVHTPAGGDAGSIEVDDAWFAIEPNVAVMHQVVTAQLAARRSGTQSTKTRSEVAGGGAKPWKQKGTGRARQGSIRSPQWRGGGVALGPKPRSYAQRTPKKMIRLALRSALSDRAAESRVAVIDEWAFGAPRTTDAVAVLDALGIEGRVLVVAARDDVAVARSFRNLPQAHVLQAGQLNAYDVLVNDWVLFTRATVPGVDDGLPTRETSQATPAEQPQSLAVAEPELWLGAEWEDDMTSDLPKRDKLERDENAGPSDPRDRVKSVSDKDDPRFAAAKARTEREAQLRARAAASDKEHGAPPRTEAKDEAAPTRRQSRRRDFSFNETDGEDER